MKEKVRKGKKKKGGKKEVRGRKVICSSIHGLRAEFHPSKVEIRVRVPANAYFYLINWMASLGCVSECTGRRFLRSQLVGHHLLLLHHHLLLLGRMSCHVILLYQGWVKGRVIVWVGSSG